MDEQQPGPVVLEVRRVGRRPRYHTGHRTAAGVILDPPQCNVDDATLERRVLPELPPMRRPWTQLCRRCYRGSRELAAALELRDAYNGLSMPAVE